MEAYSERPLGKFLCKTIRMLVAITFIITYLIRPYRMSGNSMYPSVRDGDLCMIYLPEECHINDVVYYNTGIKSESTSERNTSGKIESMVSIPTIPTENNSSNFGIGYEYNISSNGTISVHIADNWWVFAPIQETISNPESID